MRSPEGLVLFFILNVATYKLGWDNGHRTGRQEQPTETTSAAR